MKNSRANDFFVFGHFGLVTNQLDGQTVKTRSVHQLLEEKLGGKVTYYDTEELKTNKWGFIQALFRLLKTKHVIYLPAQNNLRYFFPVLFFLSRIFRFNIHCFLIGGWLPEYIRNKKIHLMFLKRLTAIYCETNYMISKMETLYGFTNAHLIPNFRLSSFIPEIKKNANTLRLVFMSRIMLKKGVGLILRFADYISKNDYNNKIIIDFYGPTNEYEREKFENDISAYPFLDYKGILQPGDIHYTLSAYDCMLFPTLFKGEGFPGAIIDAYISGIPVIASRISHNHEFIEHGKTGFLFNLSDEMEFFNYILKIEEDRKLLTSLKQYAVLKSKEYSAESAWDTIEKTLFVK